MWDLPGPGIEPVSPALAGGFLTTVPPGKPRDSFIISPCQTCIRCSYLLNTHTGSQSPNLVVGRCLSLITCFLITKSTSRTSLGCLRAVGIVPSQFWSSHPRLTCRTAARGRGGGSSVGRGAGSWRSCEQRSDLVIACSSHASTSSPVFQRPVLSL